MKSGGRKHALLDCAAKHVRGEGVASGEGEGCETEHQHQRDSTTHDVHPAHVHPSSALCPSILCIPTRGGDGWERDGVGGVEDACIYLFCIA